MAFGVIRNVRKVFQVDELGSTALEPVVALDDASFQFEQGDLVALLGPSGCGKTTLLRIVGGLIAKSAGSVAIGGPRGHQADGRLRLRVSGAEPDAVAQRPGQCPVPDGDPAKERRGGAAACARASGSGGTDRVPVGAAASVVRGNAAARRALSCPHSPAPAAADGRAVRRARRAHQDGDERSAASHPSRDQGVGPVRDAFDFGSGLSLRQGHRVQQAAGAGREGDTDPAGLSAQPRGPLHGGVHHGRTDCKRGARRDRAIARKRSRRHEVASGLAAALPAGRRRAHHCRLGLACWFFNIPDGRAAVAGQGAALVDHPERSAVQRRVDHAEGDLVRIRAGAGGRSSACRRDRQLATAEPDVLSAPDRASVRPQSGIGADDPGLAGDRPRIQARDRLAGGVLPDHRRYRRRTARHAEGAAGAGAQSQRVAAADLRQGPAAGGASRSSSPAPRSRSRWR